VSSPESRADRLIEAFRIGRIQRPGRFATDDGGVLLEWSDPSKITSIEVTSDGYELLHLRAGGKTAYQRFVDDIYIAINWVATYAPRV
jgi:hypothetical protein